MSFNQLAWNEKRFHISEAESNRLMRMKEAAPEMYELLHDYVFNFEYGQGIEIYSEAKNLLARIDGEEIKA